VRHSCSLQWLAWLSFQIALKSAEADPLPQISSDFHTKLSCFGSLGVLQCASSLHARIPDVCASREALCGQQFG
jgi:hypothetical protein